MKLITLTAALCLLTGCANLTHYTKTQTTATGPGVTQKTTFIDAKQRAIITSVKKDVSSNTYQTISCAEPSPDALSALSAANNLSIDKGDLTAGGSNALTESAGSIGLRTQSIQLMRDSMYRLCEAYQSGAIDAPAYENLSRRFQSSMVAILAIEQLTGVVRPPAIALGGTADTGNAETLAKYTDQYEKAKLTLTAAEKARDDFESGDYKTVKEKLDALKVAEAGAVKVAGPAATDTADAEAAGETVAGAAPVSGAEETAAPAANTTEEVKQEPSPEMATAQKEFDDAEKKLKGLKDTVSVRKDSVDAANAVRVRAQAASLSTTGATELEVLYSQNSDHISSVSKSVENIVNTTLDLQFGRELCTTVLSRSLESGAHTQVLVDSQTKLPLPVQANRNVIFECLDYLKQSSTSLLAQTNSNTALNNKLIEIMTADNYSDIMDHYIELRNSGTPPMFAGPLHTTDLPAEK